MAANSQFAMATHIMTAIAAEEGDLVSSAYLAGSLNTNPVVVRRILLKLQKANLITSEHGRNGGARLASSPQKITLADIYKAVDDDLIFAYNPNDPNKKCPMSCVMKSVLQPVFNKATQALNQHLNETKLSDLLKEVQKTITKEKK